jgi:hypothetical protein
MRNTKNRRLFIKDEKAISEEFTVLPALSIVMVGFAVFFALLAQTYLSYTDHIHRLQNYQTADHILESLTNPDCFFIKDGGLIDIQFLQDNRPLLENICEQYRKSGIRFFLRLQCGNLTMDLPEMLLHDSFNSIAISKEIGVLLDEAHTIPGVLTIILWRDAS